MSSRVITKTCSPDGAAAKSKAAKSNGTKSKAAVGTDWRLKLQQLIKSRKALVGVFGLGAIGLQLAVSIAARGGMRVFGFDPDASKIKQLKAGKSYLIDLPSETIAAAVQEGTFVPTTDLARVAEVDIAIICVPTPLNEHREPNMVFVQNAARSIARHARPGQMIILESTLYPGAAREWLGPVFREHGFTLEDDLFLAFSPERCDPGGSEFAPGTIPQVVGAEGPKSLDLACQFYGTFVETVVPVSSSATAEAIKLTEILFRAVNIALMNELKVVYAAMGVDIWEVIKGVNTKPFGAIPFTPGPGVGGHYIPISPFYLSWKAREYGMPTRFIDLFGVINSEAPRYVVGRLAESLDQQSGRGLKDARILIVGVAYKKNFDDCRESPALPIMSLLRERGAKVFYYDPLVPEMPAHHERGRVEPAMESIEWAPRKLGKYDAALIVTDHDCVDYAMLTKGAPLIVDARNACGSRGLSGPNIVKA
jgi:UDP-N-acetyl-D-glucosamine dehydrogenase